MSTALSTRALNRALLARQLLLRRDPRTPEAALERLLALQAQQARPPFIALWSRLDAFDRCQLLDAIHARRIVRSTFLRGTLHLATAPDYLRFRASLQPVLDAGMTSILKARGAVIDVDAIVARARQEFATPRTFTEVRTALLEQFPDADERAMGYAARMSLPLVIAPDTSEFGYPPDPRFTNAATWLGGPLDDTAAALEALVRRYLAACGPATVADAQTWSGLSQLKPVFERLRPELHVFREGKRELFDLPNAPLPDEDTPAPVRFLPGFDGVLLSHKDRSRIIADEYRPLVSTKNLQVLPIFLVDGFAAGTWDIDIRRGSATITARPFQKLAARVKEELEAEAIALARFLAPDAARHDFTY